MTRGWARLCVLALIALGACGVDVDVPDLTARWHYACVVDVLVDGAVVVENADVIACARDAREAAAVLSTAPDASPHPTWAEARACAVVMPLELCQAEAP